MIEYAKVVLPQVYIWRTLFRKELEKCYNWMSEEERLGFYTWCYANFRQTHPDVLADVFKDLTQELEMMPSPRSNIKRITRKLDNFAHSA